jgi:PPOX class probable F420-dependent enzyme
MTHDDALAFLATHHRAVFATHRAGGGVQLSPVMTAVDGEGRVVVSTRESAMKTRNVRRDPRASICVISDGFFGEWHTIEGSVEVLALPAAMEPLVAYYRSVSGEHDDWDDYRRAMERENRVLLRLTVERSGPTQQG